MSRRSKGKNRNRWKVLGGGASEPDQTIVNVPPAQASSEESEPKELSEPLTPEAATIVAAPAGAELTAAPSDPTIVAPPRQDLPMVDTPTVVMEVDPPDPSGTEPLPDEEEPAEALPDTATSAEPETAPATSTETGSPRTPRRSPCRSRDLRTRAAP